MSFEPLCLAGFQVIMPGRFWVFTEGSRRRFSSCSSVLYAGSRRALSFRMYSSIAC
jgi:hypothetical protein